MWLNLGGITDFVEGAESDSGRALDVFCPHCRTYHLVTLSKLNWFLYLCDGAVISGKVDDFERHCILTKDTANCRDN